MKFNQGIIMRCICLLAFLLTATCALSQGSLDKKYLVTSTNVETQVRVTAQELGIPNLDQVPLYDHFALVLEPSTTNKSENVSTLIMMFLQISPNLKFLEMHVTPTDDIIFKFETLKQEKVFYKIGGAELAKRAQAASHLQGAKGPVQLRINKKVLLEIYKIPTPPPRKPVLPYINPKNAA